MLNWLPGVIKRATHPIQVSLNDCIMTQPAPDDPADTWIRVARSSEIEDDHAIEVVVQKHILAIFRSRGVLSALDGMCAHQGGPIADGAISHGCVTCPWHGWQYELATGIQTINRKTLQRVYPVKESGGDVFVRLHEGD